MRKKCVLVLVVGAVVFALAGAQIAPVIQSTSLPVLKTPDFSQLTVYPVVRIVDGDTIVVIDAGKKMRVRLIGIDTPETVHPAKPVEYYGKEASLFTRNLLKGEKVYLVSNLGQNETDQYGRILAYIYRVPDGLFINAEIIRQGYGRAYTRFPFKYIEEFKQLEQFAKKAEKGLWESAPVVQKPISEVIAPPVIEPKRDARPDVIDKRTIKEVLEDMMEVLEQNKH